LTKSDNFYKKGDIIFAPFPYQEATEKQKERPVLIIAPDFSGNGFICAYITSNSNQRKGIIEIQRKDFKEGFINNNYDASYVKIDRICTLDKKVFRRKCGTLRDEIVDNIINLLIELLRKSPEQKSTPTALERPKKTKRKDF
jgi:mRNA interferase MazF